MSKAKTQTIYGLISDGGDGSASMRWYRTQAEVDHMLDEDNGYEDFWAANEGSASRSFRKMAKNTIAANMCTTKDRRI